MAQARDGAKKEHHKLKKAAEKAAGGLASGYIAKKVKNADAARARGRRG